MKTAWNIYFPMRPCWTCGARPVGFYPDGSPLYGHRHTAANESDLFELVQVPLMVTLTDKEREQAVECAEKRIAAARARSSEDQLGEYSLRSHRLGALGERAFAKWAGVRWRCSMNDFGGRPDVAGVQVRAVGRPEYRLIVHETDPDATPVLLVLTSRDPVFELRGWIPAGRAKRQAWIRDPDSKRPAFFVPQLALQDPATMPVRR